MFAGSNHDHKDFGAWEGLLHCANTQQVPSTLSGSVSCPGWLLHTHSCLHTHTNTQEERGPDTTCCIPNLIHVLFLFNISTLCSCPYKVCSVAWSTYTIGTYCFIAPCTLTASPIDSPQSKMWSKKNLELSRCYCYHSKLPWRYDKMLFVKLTREEGQPKELCCYFAVYVALTFKL